MTNETTSKNEELSRGNALLEDGVQAWRRGDFDAAGAPLKRSLEIFREQGEQTGIVRALHFLGNVSYSQGDYPGARSHHEQVLQICRGLGLQEGIASSLNNLGLIAMQQRAYRAGQEAFAESLRIYRELEIERGIAGALHNLGAVAMQRGDDEHASIWFSEGLEMALRLEDAASIARSLEAIANLAARKGEHERAARLWGAAQRLYTAPRSPEASPDRSDYSRDIQATRIALGEEKFTATWDGGGAIPVEQVVREELERSSHGRGPAFS